MTVNVGRQVFRGSILSYGSFLTSKMLTFVSTLILARLLAPGDFGLVGYALLVLGFLFVLKNMGMGIALIYRQDLSDAEAGEVFVIAVVSALLFCGLTWLIAPIAALFFHNTQITLVTRVLGCNFVIGALGDVHNAQLQKRMRFGRRFVPSFLSSLTKGGVSITLALAGFGYWSLIWGQLAGEAVATLASWALYPWQPDLQVRWTSMRRLLHYGAQIAVLELVGLVLLNADNVIVGRGLGSAALGMYALAYSIPQMLTINLSGAVSQAVFPAFATLQAERPALRRGYLLVLRYTALVLVPIGLGVCAVAPAFVHTFYKPAWWPMIPALQALAIYATILAVGWSGSDAFMAIGRPDLQWKLDVTQTTILVPALILGMELDGIVGVALAQVAVVLPYSLARYWLVHRILGVDYSGIAAALRNPVIAGAGLLAACLALELPVVPHPANSVLVVSQIALGSTVYGILVLCLDPELRARLRRGPQPVPASACPASNHVRTDSPECT